MFYKFICKLYNFCLSVSIPSDAKIDFCHCNCLSITRLTDYSLNCALFPNVRLFFGAIESTFRMQNNCFLIERLKRVWHNRVQAAILSHLRVTGWTVFYNLPIDRCITNFITQEITLLEYVPDILAVSPDGSHSLVLNIEFIFVSSGIELQNRQTVKQTEFTQSSVRKAVWNKLAGLGHFPSTLNVYSFVFGIRKSLQKCTFIELLNLDVTSHIGAILDSLF